MYQWRVDKSDWNTHQAPQEAHDISKIVDSHDRQETQKAYDDRCGEVAPVQPCALCFFTCAFFLSPICHHLQRGESLERKCKHDRDRIRDLNGSGKNTLRK